MRANSLLAPPVLITYYQYMTDNPLNTSKPEVELIRDDRGRFLPGSRPPLPQKGRLGGRALALRTLDSVMAREKNQENLANALQAHFDEDPVRFFKQIIMPLLPQEVKMKLGEEGAISWVRLSTMFPTPDNEPSTPVIDVSEPSAADDAGARPSVSQPSYSTGQEEKPPATTDG